MSRSFLDLKTKMVWVALLVGTAPVYTTAASYHLQAEAGYRPPDSTGFTVPGLNFKYYQGTWTSLPNFASLAAVDSDTCSSFDLTQVTHRASNFGFVFTGFLNVDFDDDFTFYLNSSDGPAFNRRLHRGQQRRPAFHAGAGQRQYQFGFGQTQNHDSLFRHHDAVAGRQL